MHWANKIGTPLEPTPSKGNQVWSERRKRLEGELLQLEQTMGLQTSILPWSDKAVVIPYAVGNTVKSMFLYLWICHHRKIVLLECDQDRSHGVFGIMGFKILDQDSFKRGMFPLPVPKAETVEGHPDLKMKTLQKYWRDAGFSVLSEDRVHFSKELQDAHRDQMDRAELRRMNKGRSDRGVEAASAPTKRGRFEAPVTPPPLAAPGGVIGPAFRPVFPLAVAPAGGAVVLPMAPPSLLGAMTTPSFVLAPLPAVVPPPAMVPLPDSVVAVAALLSLANTVVPRQMAKERLDRAIDAYRAAAREMRDAGNELAKFGN